MHQAAQHRSEDHTCDLPAGGIKLIWITEFGSRTSLMVHRATPYKLNFKRSLTIMSRVALLETFSSTVGTAFLEFFLTNKETEADLNRLHLSSCDFMNLYQNLISELTLRKIGVTWPRVKLLLTFETCNVLRIFFLNFYGKIIISCFQNIPSQKNVFKKLSQFLFLTFAKWQKRNDFRAAF